MQKHFISKAVIWIVAVASASACYAQEEKFRYDLAKPEIIELPKAVNEISGMSYYSPGNAVFAIDDDHGDLFKIELRQNPSLERLRFGKDRDYEDLVIINGYVFVLKSDGQIVYFPFRKSIENTKKEMVVMKGKGEFESLYKDPSADRLIMLCKDCNTDKKDENPAFAFDLATFQFRSSPVFSLQRKEIEKHYGKKTGPFKPSATSVHPLTKNIYIISSINKLLVVADAQLRVKKVVELDKDLFPQPEGICFSPGGDLLISNEATKKKKANILIFSQQ